MSDEWVTDPRAWDISHRGDMPWDEVRPPFPIHKCRAQTRSLTIDRCACGAMRVRPYPGWIERNSRGMLARWKFQPPVDDRPFSVRERERMDQFQRLLDKLASR